MKIPTPAETATLWSEQPPDVRKRREGLSDAQRALLDVHAANLGQWLCKQCVVARAQIDTTQSAKQKQVLKTDGGWDLQHARSKHCSTCGRHRPHHQLKSLQPRTTTRRHAYTRSEQAQIKKHLGGRDAFTGTTGGLEVDHRIPRQRADTNEARVDPSDSEAVRENFMLLTRANNLRKDRACTKCVKTGIRPPFLGFDEGVYTRGGPQHDEAVRCGGCPWAYPEELRTHLLKIHKAQHTPPPPT